ncbi:alpha/beta hydrolase [Jatrophihabitans fulvus]
MVRVVTTDRAPRAPALSLFLTEPARTITRLGAYPLAARTLERAPRPAADDAHGVLVLPGLMTSDSSTVLLRRFVRGLGHTTWGWRLGRNLGPTAEILEGMPKAIDALRERTGGPVSIIGWSLGGIFARELARRRPETVRQVITLGSPFALRDPRQSRVGFAYRRHEKQHRAPGPGADTSRPIPVPSTAIFSKRDGIVHWRSCVEPETERHQNVEVRCAHLTYGTDLASLWVVADRLAQPRPAEHPFTVPPSLQRWFPA